MTRFDDRVPAKLDEFCPHARKIRIDIDPESIDKVVKVDVPIVGDCGVELDALLSMPSLEGLPLQRLAPGGSASSGASTSCRAPASSFRNN